MILDNKQYKDLVTDTNETFRELLNNLQQLRLYSADNFTDIDFVTPLQQFHYSFIRHIVKPLEK